MDKTSSAPLSFLGEHNNFNGSEISYKKPQQPITEVSIQDSDWSEFFDALRGAAVILFTSSPDKRAKYQALFNGMKTKEGGEEKGVDFYFTDSGALNIPPRKTPEKSGNYSSHASEKLEAALASIDDDIDGIRAKLRRGTLSNPDDIRLVAMVEDSGMHIKIKDTNKKTAFLEEVKNNISPFIRDKDAWIFNHSASSFPGPNLKPFQEHLPGGFNQLMEIIYDAAEKVELEELNFISKYRYGFVSHDTGKAFTIERKSRGTLVDRERFETIKANLRPGDSIDMDAVLVPNGQRNNATLNVKEIGTERFFTRHTQLPFSYGRRNLTEWLQDGIGARKATDVEKERPLHIAYVAASDLEEKPGFEVEQQRQQTAAQFQPLLDDIAHEIITLPTYEALCHQPNRRMLNGADMLVLRPEPPVIGHEGLVDDPNLRLLSYIDVTLTTDPLSMTMPVILDNRDGGFNHALQHYTNAYRNGRFLGEFPFKIANSDDELTTLLRRDALIQRRSKIATDTFDDVMDQLEMGKTTPLPPDDGIPTAFVAGGHANNNRQDIEEAFELGYQLAAQKTRIVTGGGQVEGSMGATHTGFIQYHLDELLSNRKQHPRIPEHVWHQLDKFAVHDEEDPQKPENLLITTAHPPLPRRYDAEEIIKNGNGLLNRLADEFNIIPRDMFWAYSTDALVKMESPTDAPPEAATFHYTGNRVRRLDALIAPEMKMILPGGIGTDEEIFATIKQQMDATLNQMPLSRVVLYNRGGQLNDLLKSIGLMDTSDQLNEAAMEHYNIDVVDQAKDILLATGHNAGNFVTDAQQEGRVLGSNSLQLTG